MSKNIFTISGALIALALVTTVSAQSVPVSATGTVVVNQIVTSTSVSPTQIQPMSVSVDSKGNANVRGSVVSISGNTLTVTTWFGPISVDISNAKLHRRYGGASSISEFQTGDYVTVWGKASQGSFGITATKVQNFSVQAKNVNPYGVISNVDSMGNFTLTTGSKTYKISLTASTTITTNVHGGKGLIADIVNGENVRVTGILDRTESTITANRVELSAHKVNVYGTLSNVAPTSGTFTVTKSDSSTAQVTLTQNANIRINSGTATINDLVNGMRVQVSAYYTSDKTVLVAQQVKARTSGKVVNYTTSPTSTSTNQ